MRTFEHRDRRYSDGAAEGAPQAAQISDRRHLPGNAAFIEGVKRHMGDLRRAVAGGGIDPETLGTVRGLHGQGRSIEGIVGTAGASRRTVRPILARTREDVPRSRETTLDRWGTD